MGAAAVAPPLPPGFELDPPPPPGFELDQPAAPGQAAPAPKRQVGFAESLGRTVNAAAIPVVQTAGLAYGGVLEPVKRAAELGDQVASIFGLRLGLANRVQAGQDQAFRFADDRVASMRDAWEPKPGEQFSMPGQLAGGLLSAPIEIAGGFGTQRGMARAQDVLQRGGTLEQAQTAGGVSGSVNVLANALPVKVGGAVGRGLESAITRVLPSRIVPAAAAPAVARVAGGATSGAGIGAASNVAVTAAENAALPEGQAFEDLHREIDPATAAGVGAAFGALGARHAAPTRQAKPGEEAATRGTPGTMGSVGAAGTDMALQRRARAQNLPVPIDLTEGQATRSYEQQQFERETAKRGKVGAPLRERFAEQNDRVRQNLDALMDLTGAESADAYQAGSRVVDALAAKAAAAKRKINQAYDEARAAGDMAEPVPYAGISDYIDAQTPTTREQLAPIIKMVQEQLSRNDPSGTGAVPISALEDIRQAIRKNTQFGTPNSVHGGELMGRIDAATEGAGGEKYKAARRLYAEYAAEFKNRAAVADLLGTKRGGEDRRVALENVARRARSGSLDDLAALKRSLLGAGEAGRQAWRELQGRTIADIRDAALANVARDERGNPVVSAAALHKAIAALDKDGKLDLLLNKRGAEHMRDLADLARDVFTSPPGSVNHSNTSSAILNALDFSIGAGFGIPAAAATGVKALRDMLRNRSTAKQVAKALDAPAPASAGRADLGGLFEPEAAPPAVPREPAPAAAPPAAPKPADPRLQEIERLKEGASPETVRALDEEARRMQGEQRQQSAAARRARDVAELERTAAAAQTPELRQALQARANRLRGEAIPTGEATELPSAPTAKPEPVRGPLPVGEATGLTPEQAADMALTKRESELLRLREQASDPEVLRDLDREITAERKRTADARRGEEYLRLADAATDPDIRAAFEAKAKKLGAQRQALPVPSARELPVETVEPAPAMHEEPVLPDTERTSWLRAHRFGSLDATSADAVAQALRYDVDAVGRAVQQLDHSPRAFDREIARIIEEGKARASDRQAAVRSGPGPEPAQGRLRGQAEGAAGGAAAVAGQPGPDGAPAARAERGAADAPGRQDDRPRVADGSSGGGSAPRRPEEVAAAPVVRASPKRQAKIDESAALAAEGGVPREAVDEAVRIVRGHEGPPPVEVPPASRERLEGMLAPLVERAKAQNDAYAAQVRALAAELGAEAKTASVKGMKRAVEKLHADELDTGGRLSTPDDIKDLVRASIVVRTEADVARALEAVRRSMDVVRVKDRFKTPLPTGYRDVLMNVRLPDGMLAELQIHIPEMLAAKELGHLLYEVERAMPAGPERKSLVAAQSRLYGAAYEVAGSRLAEGQASSRWSNSARPISPSSSQLATTRPVTADTGLPPGGQTTGLPLSSKNREPGGIESFDSMSRTSTPIIGESPDKRSEK